MIKLHLLIAITFTAAIVSGCTTRKTADGVRPSDTAQTAVREIGGKQNTRLSLASAATWPGVKAAVMREAARVEGSNSAFASAYCSPCLYTNGIWAVIVHLTSPDWRAADYINILVADSGQIGAYGKRAGRSQPKPN